MTEKVAIPVAEWRKKGSELFGEDMKQWRFVCPICKTPQTIQDFVNAGVHKEAAGSSIAQECIGRYLPGSQKAISATKVIKGKPCNYAGYGFFKLNPVAVELEDGEVLLAFDFDVAI